MSDNMISFEVTGIEGVQKMLEKLPPEIQADVTNDVSDFVIELLKIYPDQRRVTRAAAYGQTFFSDQQRKFFFAALRDGRITVPYNRTYGQKDAWHKEEGSIGKITIVNQSKGVMFTRDNQRQSRHEAMVGWAKVKDVLDGSMQRIFGAAGAAVKKAIKRLGLEPK